jgi:hypothetical protein
MPAGIAYMTEPTLEFIAKQLEKVLTEQRALRDDMRVLTAMTLRVDSTMLSIQVELHEIHRELGCRQRTLAYRTMKVS